MNLDELRSVQSKERQKDSLQNLRPSFYKEVGEYIANLEDERDRVAEQAEDPFSSPEVGRLTDEIETAKDVVEAIYERRMGKLVKQASLAAAGMAADDEGLTAEEADLFDDLVDRIESNKSRVLDVLEGIDDTTVGTDAAANAEAEPPVEAGANGASDGSAASDTREPDPPLEASSQPEPTTDPSAQTDTPTPPPQEPPADVEADPASTEPTATADASSSISPADVMGGTDDESPSSPSNETAADVKPEPSSDLDGDRPTRNAAESDESRAGGSDDGSSDSTATEVPDADVDRVTVKITRDVGSILGVDDREYTLSSDDVVTLPEQNATPLVEREAAEPLE
ncbi:hypothetical protein AB7C87_03155 [Natrarchaeobius sp. A-rgal3]|uniref:DNA replication complex subunit Gins51 n=1 Tax=Natrarchaeobius versutus TaxID=1679078 RepID=UPI00350F4E59